MVLVCCHPLIIGFDCEISFHPSGAIQESFQFDFPEAIFSNIIHCSSQFFSSNLTGASFKYSLISRDPFVLMYQIPSSILIRSLILPGVPLSLLRSFPILTVVRSRFSSMVIILIHSLFQSYRWFVEDLPKLTLYLF